MDIDTSKMESMEVWEKLFATWGLFLQMFNPLVTGPLLFRCVLRFGVQEDSDDDWGIKWKGGPFAGRWCLL